MKKALLPLLVLFSVSFANAQWTSNTIFNTPVCTYTDDDANPVAVTDGAGGTIVVWEDRRSFAYDIYAQKVNASGVPQWTANGVGICTATYDQLKPFVFPDGAGGVYMVWSDSRIWTLNLIYGQHINASGTPLWGANGKELAENSNCRDLNAIADGSGGFYICYYKSNSYIYAQHINSQGDALWSGDLLVCNAASNMDGSYPKMATDGAGGVIVTWTDSRTPANNRDVYAQRINASGQIQWPANGVPIKTGTALEDNVHIVSDGAGGAIIAWSVFTNTPPIGTYAQRINAAGMRQWPIEGVTLTTTSSDYVQLLADGTNGALAYWTDYRFDSGPNATARIYTQKLDAQGLVQWPANGISLRDIPNYSQLNPIAYSNGDGHFYFAYTQVSNTSVSGYNMLYLQKMAPTGEFLWSGNGVGIGTNGYVEHSRPSIVPDNNGGMILAFSKDAAIYDGNIYVQNVHADGSVGPNLANVSFNENETVKVYPNPTQGQFTVESTVQLDKIIVLDLLGKTVLNVTPNASNAALELSKQAKGVYFVKLISGENETVKKLILN